MQPQQTHLIYEFGDFELDALRRVLVSRADGKQVAVTGRVLEALVYLVERPGQLVPKRALIEAFAHADASAIGLAARERVLRAHTAPHRAAALEQHFEQAAEAKAQSRLVAAE